MTVLGFDGKFIAEDYRPQINEKCCWAASIEKACKLIGKRVPQEHIIQGFPALKDGANAYQITEVLNTYMVGNQKKIAWIVSDLDADGPWWEEMDRRIARCIPAIALIQHPRVKCHAVVLAAIKKTMKSTEWYGAYDPWYKYQAPIQIPVAYLRQYQRQVILPYLVTN